MRSGHVGMRHPVGFSYPGALIAAAAILSGCAGGDADTFTEGAPGAFDLAPLAQAFDGDGASLGSVALPVACEDGAREPMRRGLALLHHMTYTEAAGAFRAALEEDADCGMAYWGVAMTYVHALWPDVPSDEDFTRARPSCGMPGRAV